MTTTVTLPLPILPEGWVGEKEFKAIGSLSPAIQRNLEPVGPHFLAHARRVSTNAGVQEILIAGRNAIIVPIRRMTEYKLRRTSK